MIDKRTSFHSSVRLPEGTHWVAPNTLWQSHINMASWKRSPFGSEISQLVMFVDCIIIHDHPIDGTHWWYIFFYPIYDIIHIWYHLHTWYHLYIYIYVCIIYIYILHWISQPSFMTPEGHRRVRHVAVIAPVRRRHLLQRDLCGQLQLLGTAAGLMGKMWENMGSLPWEIGISNGISWDYDGIRLRWINKCKVVLSWNRSHRVDDGW